MSKIEKISIRHFKGIDESAIELNGSSVYVIGGNGAGKSSFIDAVFTTLTGKNIPPEPIKRGETESSVEIEFDSFVAIMDYKKKRGSDDVTQKLTIVSKENGNVIERPRAWLNSIVGIIDFDATDFFSMSANKQVEYICKTLAIDVAGLDKQYRDLYDERTFRNRELARLKDAPRAYDKKIAERPLIDVADIHSQIKAATEINAKHSAAKQRLKEYQDRSAELEKQLSEIRYRIEYGENYIKELPAAVPVETIQEFETAIATADEKNAEIRSHILAKETDIAFGLAEKSVDEINDEMAAVVSQKRKILADAIQVPGLEYDGEQFLFNGLPFSNTQINTAEQLIAALQIGQSLIKDVRILRVDGSLFDKKNMERVNGWAAENGIQLFAEIVDRDGGSLTVEIVEQ